jgi:hypothetical protein
MYKSKRGQIWVETVIYSLIAFVMIGLVLAFANPRLQEIQDRTLIEQSIEVMEDLDTVITNIGIPGNKRSVEINIQKGSLSIDGVNDQLIFQLESQHTYSELGENISHGEIIINTQTFGSEERVTLTRDYSSQYNITYEENDELRELGKASTPYKLLISNKGGNKIVINIEVN